MTRHCVKYVRWEVVARWRRRVAADCATVESAYPYAFGSRDPAVLSLTGDVLWLMTLPRYGRYRQAPSLVARLDVVDTGRYDGSARFSRLDPEVRSSGPMTVFARHDPQAYLPLNNAFHTLLGLEFAGRSTRLPDVRDLAHPKPGGPYVDIAGYFQRHRWVAPAGVPSLERFGAAVRDGRRAFLSYKRSDFSYDPDWPGRLGDELAGQDVSCWWDRWYLPQGEAARQARLDEDLLDDLLLDAVRQSVWFVALVGPHLLAADEESWPRREWQRAGEERARSERRHRVHRLAVMLSDSVTGAEMDRWSGPGDRMVLVGRDPSAAETAEAIARVIDSPERRAALIRRTARPRVPG